MSMSAAPADLDPAAAGVLTPVSAAPVKDLRSAVAGLAALQGRTLGTPEVCIAVLDGPVDLSHPCFNGAYLRRLDTLVQDPAGGGPRSVHGTHVASLIFGQPNSPVVGVAPRCSGLIVPVFRDFQEGHLSQLDLARAIEQAVQEGAHIINVSGGELSPTGETDGFLARALQRCYDSNVLVVAATGNDGCDCLHVPAAFPSVLAAGAMDASGEPLESSNWGEAYSKNGVLALGRHLEGAAPGGGTAVMSGSSFATPIVSGVAALLLSIQHQIDGTIDPRAVRQAILQSASPCSPHASPECRRYLGGTLSIPGAYALTIKRGNTLVATPDVAQLTAEPGTGQVETNPAGMAVNAIGLVPSCETSTAQADTQLLGSGTATLAPAQLPPDPGGTAARPTAQAHAHGVVPSADCGCVPSRSFIFAIGNIGFDFITEARRDSFRQLMPRVSLGGSPPATVPPNPYDVAQLYEYLSDPMHPSESTKLVWTLNLDLTPIYALEAEVAYADEVYRVFRDALFNESLDPADPNYVSRVSVSGVMTNQVVRLFSGQVVPKVVVQARGLYSWNEPVLLDSVTNAVQSTNIVAEPDFLRWTVRQFLDKVYYQMRNLGQSPPDRALNFAATNAFIFADGIGSGLLSGINNVPSMRTAGEGVAGARSLYTLDTIEVSKSAYCRVDSDCWDVQISFFDPDNDQRARCVYQYTIDVSDEMPVSLAPTHQFLVAR
jgi:cyanobactin maturation PatA/PatG family protease